MARRTQPTGPTPVDAIQHPDTRTNIPTADAQEFLSDEHREIPSVVFDRDPTLDPQLVWRGKFDGDDVDALTVDAPPIYIQEKVDPRVLVENLRQTSRAGEAEPEATLFDAFDGLDEFESVDFYEHDANWANRMILGDSLQVMASLAERESLRGKVQMIYIDPPYGIKFGSNWQASARKRDVKDGAIADAAREAEQIKAFRDTWELGIHSYLSYLRDRLLVARELLTESGSVFVQIGGENVHLVRGLLDETFGSSNYVGQIAFIKTSSQGSTRIQSVFDTILVYARELGSLKFRDILIPKRPGEPGAKNYTQAFSPDLSTWRTLTKAEREDPSLLPQGWRVGRLGPSTSQNWQSGPRSEPYDWSGDLIPIPSNAHWKYDPAPGSGMDRLRALGRLKRSGKGLATVLLAEDNPTSPLDNMWTDTGTGSFTEDQTYVVQTAEKVLQRCIIMSTDPGDLVLDPTCGSGTTAHAAERWGRRWITIDTSRVATALARQRLMGARYPYFLLADSAEGRRKEQELTNAALPPAATSASIHRGFVYERAPHITLGSIANNPDIKEGMSRAEIDAAIKRHADYETLFDKPYEDKSRVRVSGPFTVESLSPHRSLAFAPEDEPRSEVEAAQESETFEQTVLDNLAKAGVQNGRRAERIEFSAVERYPGTYVQAIGERRTASSPTTDDSASNETEPPTRVAVAVGPQYGTVSPQFIKDAAREAIRAGSVDLLCVLGFAFDAQATGVTQEDTVTVETEFAQVAGERSLGRIKVLLVRMNVDLLMGEALKKTGAGNLFTVFGEPDIELTEQSDGRLVVDLLGVDIYDPTTGEVRSDDTSKIALWMIDTNYNEESFFVRHCYFTGGNDPYKRLKTALKADIDADAWETLYRTTSRPFDRPVTGKIAVKVINDYGDEVMKVFAV